MNWKKAVRPILLTINYALMAGGSLGAALWLRFDGMLPPEVRSHAQRLLLPFIALTLLAYLATGLYRSLWRYAGTETLAQIARAVSLSALALILLRAFMRAQSLPLSVVAMVWLLQLVALGAMRMAYRMGRERAGRAAGAPERRTLVLGATPAGVRLIQEMRRHAIGPDRLTPAGVLDDDARLSGREIEGVRVLGAIADLPAVLAHGGIAVVLISNPELPAKRVREIAAQCSAAGVALKTVPDPVPVPGGGTSLARIRDVRIEDLLGRQAVRIEIGEVAALLRGQCVLITGAGGSIGSELARQVAGFEPSELVLLDRAENGLHYVHSELSQARPNLALHARVGDIRDAEAMERLFAQFRPVVVLHAAAHKHVPLLEHNPSEAVLNNVIGTRTLIQCAERHGTAKFVLISTDKAVNPASVMGASKRLCEMLLQSRSGQSATRFVAVRFGNVLGSEGSVIPLFQRQLARGGPLTVTDPQAMRYFMTIEESVRLVLQAAAMGVGGEVFLLDMGEPVRILELARQLIQLAGLREGEDIEIVFTGLRPGEKLREELHSESERARITRHQHIMTWELAPTDDGLLAEGLTELERAARAG
ncbi:MAG: polysaccharide biosynthesis protein, partial [Candidatus Eiseniibacteriota bacterium]